jgi:putative spermidine/putrescine transport system substrate-binding protein
LRLARVTHRWTSVGSLEALFSTGAVTLALGSPRVALASAAPALISATVPSEGAVGLVDTLALPSGAPHPVCAYRFLSYMLEPATEAAIAAVSQLTPAVPAACRPLGRRACTRLHANANDQWGPRVQFARRPVPPAVPWSSWLTAWRALARS